MVCLCIHVPVQLVSHFPARQIREVHIDAHSDYFFVVSHSVESFVVGEFSVAGVTLILCDFASVLCVPIALSDVVRAFAVDAFDGDAHTL